jgi:2-C-methyl-D-erythritol 4-phosphate cytidylyltransferase
LSATPPRAAWCVIPAAGAGSRMGRRVPKQYLELLGKPMLLRTLDRIASHPRIAGVVVALAADDPRWPGLVMAHGKPVLTATGGAERAHSVLAGLEVLEPFVAASDLVLVHDAARPAVRHADIERLIDAALAHPVGALLALPVADTLKRAGAQNEVEATVPREKLWRALTPQAFRLGELLEALRFAIVAGGNDAQMPTDESNALEVLGKFPVLVESCADNLKVTRVQDLALMEAILRTQGER